MKKDESITEENSHKKINEGVTNWDLGHGWSEHDFNMYSK